MLSQSRKKLIRSLSVKKYRDRNRLFMIEGETMVRELLQRDRDRIEEVIATQSWIEGHENDLNPSPFKVTGATDREIAAISQLTSPRPVVAVVRMPVDSPDPGSLADETVLGLESVRDPGNLGSIIRTCGWFGIRQVVCTADSVDLYNPKVVQASMGALFRVEVRHTDLAALLNLPRWKAKPVYGTFPSGDSIYETPIGPAPVILFGNESRGLSSRYTPFLTARIAIPPFSGTKGSVESLNLSASVAVVCSELRRREAFPPTRSENSA